MFKLRMFLGVFLLTKLTLAAEETDDSPFPEVDRKIDRIICHSQKTPNSSLDHWRSMWLDCREMKDRDFAYFLKQMQQKGNGQIILENLHDATGTFSFPAPDSQADKNERDLSACLKILGSSSAPENSEKEEKE